MVERAERKKIWHAPLVVRPKLSSRAVRGLAGYVAGTLLRELESRNDLYAETAGAVYDAISRRLAEEAEPGEPLPEERAAALHAKGKLDEGAVTKALGTVDRGFVIAALALASGLSRPAVQKVVSLASAKGIVAVVWARGFQHGARRAAAAQARAHCTRRDDARRCSWRIPDVGRRTRLAD